MEATRPYASPKSFRQALTDKLKQLAQHSKWDLPQLQRQFAYDRLLARLYVHDNGWILMGATALNARGIGVRGTLDIDLYRQVETAVAAQELRSAVALEMDDWFEFELGAALGVSDAATSLRIPVKALIGGAVWSTFHVDLVGAEVTMTGSPDEAPPLARISILDFAQCGYSVYPLVDHIADKVTATFDRYGPAQAPSTRYKDLVDLVALTKGVSVKATAQMKALSSEAKRRKIELPKLFEVPARDLWEPGYAAEAKRSLLDIALNLDAALEIVTPFLDPLLEGNAKGTWNPAAGRWEQDGPKPASAPQGR
ncbi:MAG: nucleotidyl transferase AbiEii/AbiGii toxin family protein [Solirubrobacterales bacterium]